MDDGVINQKIPLLEIPFIQNTGQIENQTVQYYVDTFAGRVFVTDDDITYAVDNGDSAYAIKERVHQGTSFPAINGIQQSTTNVSSFIGNDPDKWKSHIPTYDGVSLGQIWEGIDVSLYAYGNNVEKIFTVMPGYNPSEIKLSYDGVSRIQTDADGNLVLYSVNDDNVSVMSMKYPVAYQQINGQKISADVKYDVVNDTTYGFIVGAYDESYPLVIDPLIQSTYLGGSADDFSYRILLDDSGNVFVATDSDSTNFPGTAGGAQAANGGGFDLIVSKLNSGLTSITQSTYIGGSGSDEFAHLVLFIIIIS